MMTGDYEVTAIPNSEMQRAQKKDGTQNTIEEGFVHEGAKVGTWLNYYPNGRLNIVSSYIDGKLNLNR